MGRRPFAMPIEKADDGISFFTIKYLDSCLRKTKRATSELLLRKKNFHSPKFFEKGKKNIGLSFLAHAAVISVSLGSLRRKRIFNSFMLCPSANKLQTCILFSVVIAASVLQITLHKSEKLCDLRSLSAGISPNWCYQKTWRKSLMSG